MENILKQQRFSGQAMETSEEPLIEFIELNSQEKKEGIIKQNMIVFLLKGSCLFTSDLYKNQLIREGHALFLPLGSVFNFISCEESFLLIMRIDIFQKLKDGFSLEELYKSKTSKDNGNTGLLSIHPLLYNYLTYLKMCLVNKMDSHSFFEIKIKELFILLNRLYTKDHLAHFFDSVLNADFQFATFVLNNWHKVKKAQELAELSHYSETAFGKKFKQVFGTSPYKWIQQKRSAQIYYDINNTMTPFKVIAEKHRFKSLQHFNDYCLRHFHQTPGGLRRRKS